LFLRFACWRRWIKVNGFWTLLFSFPRLRSETWGTLFLADCGQGQGRRFALLSQKKKQARDPFPVRCAQGQDDKFNNNGKGKGKGNGNRNGKNGKRFFPIRYLLVDLI
jgi:hypothetical protein